MLSWSFALVIGLLTGILSGFGIGGGTILMIYLTAFAAFPQKIAQSINLLYFIPTAAAALMLHSKHHQLKWNAVLPAATLSAAFSRFHSATTVVKPTIIPDGSETATPVRASP